MNAHLTGWGRHPLFIGLFKCITPENFCHNVFLYSRRTLQLFDWYPYRFLRGLGMAKGKDPEANNLFKISSDKNSLRE